MNTTDDKNKKKIKDPLYGYIPVDKKYIKDIIDTPVFQRLRRVIQTSYSPLYSSTLHNRFVHSLGVFYLGNIVATQLKTAILEGGYLEGIESVGDTEEYVSNLVHIYLLACLLHDIGHAPFSHTGEVYYKQYIDEDGKEQFDAQRLHDKLCGVLKSPNFKKDLPVKSDSAAPHELMSALVGIESFGKQIGNNENKEFFVRCITGYKYKEEKGYVADIKNCFVGMLNSKVIDVDRLDYLIRDAYTSGFATINIDYVRLLSALTIKKYANKLQLVYRKDAISVIENVVYAHDSERKWIQNHPVVLYEAYIIKHILETLTEKLDIDKDEKRLFSKKSLSEEGHFLKDDIKVSLLCDDDIIYLSKNVFSDSLSKELFDRDKRRHPVWKSEAEYKAYIDSMFSSSWYREEFVLCMNSFIGESKSDHPVPIVINEDYLKRLKGNLKKAAGNRQLVDNITRNINVCEYLEAYAKKHHFHFDYVVVPTSFFTSNFSKEHLNKVLIDFDGKNPVKLEEVCSLLSADKAKDIKDFYYLFYRRGKETRTRTGKIDDLRGFCEGLVAACSKDVE